MQRPGPYRIAFTLRPCASTIGTRHSSEPSGAVSGAGIPGRFGRGASSLPNCTSSSDTAPQPSPAIKRCRALAARRIFASRSICRAPETSSRHRDSGLGWSVTLMGRPAPGRRPPRGIPIKDCTPEVLGAQFTRASLGEIRRPHASVSLTRQRLNHVELWLARAYCEKWNGGTLESKYVTSLARLHSLTVGTLGQRLIGTLAPASHSSTVPRVPPRARSSPLAADGIHRALVAAREQRHETGRYQGRSRRASDSQSVAQSSRRVRWRTAAGSLAHPSDRPTGQRPATSSELRGQRKPRGWARGPGPAYVRPHTSNRHCQGIPFAG